MVRYPARIHLVTQPSFITGIARILDWSGDLSEYNSVLTPGTADYYAMLSDWQAVGDDLREAMRIIDGELQHKSNEPAHNK